MKNHYLEAPNEIKEEDRRQLPNRNNFAEFYYDPVISSYTKETNYKKPLSRNELKLIAKVMNYYITVGFLIPLPFIIGKLLYEFITQNIHVSNIAITQPSVFFSAIILIFVFIIVYKKVFEIFEYVGYRAFFFLTYILTCLSLVSLPLYLICNSFNTWLIRELAFYSAITIFSIIISKVLFMPIVSGLSRISKASILISIFAICLVVAVLTGLIY